MTTPNIVFWDGPLYRHLLPFTFTRPGALIRCGILTIAEKYEKRMAGAKVSYLAQPYLQANFPLHTADDNLLIQGTLLPTADLIQAIEKLAMGESLWQGEQFLAARVDGSTLQKLAETGELPESKKKNLDGTATVADRIWKIFSLCEQEIKADFAIITQDRQSQPIPASNFVKNPENIFLEEGAVVEFASLNAASGPIYIGKDAEVMEGSLVRGPFALGEHSQLKMAAKIYGATSIGPHCKVGGEVNNSVFFGYSNKAHDGFVGNAVIGEWCNLGADSNNSNLKNNYEEVKLWNYALNSFEKTGLQFCGLFMGDHSKCGINTMFNTGTVVGVSANIFGSGFPRNFIPSFSWGGASGFSVYQLKKAIDTAARVYARRGIPFTADDQAVMSHIFDETQSYRNF